MHLQSSQSPVSPGSQSCLRGSEAPLSGTRSQNLPNTQADLISEPVRVEGRAPGDTPILPGRKSRTPCPQQVVSEFNREIDNQVSPGPVLKSTRGGSTALFTLILMTLKSKCRSKQTSSKICLKKFFLLDANEQGIS